MKLTDVLQFDYELVQGDLQVDIEDIVYNSKQVKTGCLFIAVKGARFDAHDVLAEVAKDGARAILIEHDCALPSDVTVIKVKSSRKALAKVSAAFFCQPIQKMISIAVTGTKGKTTTAHMIKTILEEAGKKVGMIGTNGIVIGDKKVPSLNTTPESFELHRFFQEMVDAKCDAVVMEASSQGVKMFRTYGITFDYGIFTNISPDHIGPNEHENFEEYLQCKADLFLQCKTMLLNGDDVASAFIQEQVCNTRTVKDTKEVVDASHAMDANNPLSTVLRYGKGEGCDLRFFDVRFHSDEEYMGIAFEVEGLEKLSNTMDQTIAKDVVDANQKKRKRIDAAIPGLFNAYNALAAVTVCACIGVSDEVLTKALKKIHVDGRMETAFTSKDFTIIIDYAHNAVSMEKLLDTLRDYQPKRLVVVFGCGGNRSKDRRYTMGESAGKKADLSILTADNSRFEKVEDIIEDIKSTLVPTGGAYLEIPDRKDAIYYAISHRKPGDLIAIIGKGHEDYQEINGIRTHFLDREVVDTALQELGVKK